jgi:leader peptidase (prepilin peptidase)/N-methyltransferase
LSWFYPLSEIVAGFVGMYVVASYGHNLALLLGACGVSIGLLITLFADYKYQMIPDIGIVIGVLGALVFNGQLSGLASLPYYGLIGLVNALFILLIVLATRGRGMGLGDVTLAFFMGVFLGFPLTLFAMYIAFLTGAGVGVILIMTRRKSLKSAIAFGPFLVAGTILSVIWQTGLITYWNNLW